MKNVLTIGAKNLVSACLFMAGLSICFGHHAMEYIELESAHIPDPGARLLHIHYDYMVEDDANPNLDHWEYTPGAAFGIGWNTMIDVHFHWAKFGADHLTEGAGITSPQGPSPFIEAAAFTVQNLLIDHPALQIGWSATWEVPSDKSRDLLDGKEVFSSTLILSKTFFEHQNLTLNASYELENGEECTILAVGGKMPFTQMSHGISGGLEISGDTDDFAESVIYLPGVYFPLSSSTIIKTGLGFNADFDFHRMSLSLMYNF